MKLSAIELSHFRSHNQTFQFNEGVTYITGSNGAGKTNLLEAIYVLLSGSSFRATDAELAEYDARWWRVKGVLENQTRDVRYQKDKLPHKLLIENEKSMRFTYKQRLPVVLFEPNDLLFIQGSPSRRRDVINATIGSYDHGYKLALGRYERVLKQRNTALKTGNATDDLLFAWEVSLSEYGAQLINARREFVDMVNKHIPELYTLLSGKEDRVALFYQAQSTTSSQLLSMFHKQRAHDKQRQTTTLGPHRDDFDFSLNEKSAKQTASRGETRSILLSLKASQALHVEQVFQTEPIVLLDDVFSELDKERQGRVMAMMRQYQMIISDTKTSKARGTIRL